MRSIGACLTLFAVAAIGLGDRAAIGGASPQSPLDAPDKPVALAASQAGGYWIGVETDTFAGILGYDADASERSSFMVFAFEPALAVDSVGNLFVGGFSSVWPAFRSSIFQFSNEGRHLRSWSDAQTAFVDLDVSPTDEVFALQLTFEHDDEVSWPLVANNIVRYSTDGRRIDELETADPLTEIAVDSSGRVFVAGVPSSGRSLVEQLHPDGTLSAAFEINGAVTGMDFGMEGDLFIAAVLEDDRGLVSRFRPTMDGADLIAEWDTCDRPIDIAVTGEASVVVLADTSERDSSIGAICQYDGLGAVVRKIQIPVFTGLPYPRATPVPGWTKWLPLVVDQY